MNNFQKQYAEFNKIYKSAIFPILAGYEEERKKLALKIIVQTIIAVILFLPIIILGLAAGGVWFCVDIVDKYVSPLTLLLTLAGLIAGSYVIVKLADAPKLRKDFTNKLKKECLPKIIKVFGNISWKNNDTFQKTLVPDDVFYGTHNGIEYTISEYAKSQVCIGFKTNKKINSKTIIETKFDTRNTFLNLYFVFSLSCGLLLILVFLAKCWSAHDAVMMLQALIISIGILCIYVKFILDKLKLHSQFERVNLEDSEFQKRFKVSSKDQIESRYFLTPAFMERFKNLGLAFGATNMRCTAYGNEIQFKLDISEDLFEVGDLFDTLKKPDYVWRCYRQIKSILGMIDYFKLDEKTGL